ncbi:MAG: hypothetical protein KFH98_08520 [Gemmatimonadetes bacterium]|nr:hypothetical protein [Gemmatimonadota bacterium]
MTRSSFLAASLAAGLFTAGPQLIAAQQTAAQKPADKSTEWLIAAAVLAAPAPLRDGAEVRAWTADGELRLLRAGTNGLICLAGRPDETGFAASCYHASLEPFMGRGRELIREGIEGARRNEIRWREIEDGTIPMPAMAMVYNFRYPVADFDPATTDPATGTRLHALYIPGATTESTGVSALPSDEPWLMLPGTPSAHVMISLPRKQP